MAESKFSFSVLNVGQGNMQLVEEGDTTNIVVDCNISKAPELVRRYLGRRNVDHIDVIVLTGTDEDHADPEGLRMLINKTQGKIGEVWHPDFQADTDSWKEVLKILVDLKKNGTKIWMPKAGDMRTINGLTIKILSPHPEDSDTSNNASIVLSVAADQVSILLPGDCESEQRWNNIVKYFGKWLPSNVLVAPHHGSMNGCVEAAVKLIAPEYTVISCGEDNQHGHPHDEAVEIYERHTSKEVLITHEVGSILFETDGLAITQVITDAGQDPAARKTESLVKRLPGKATRRTSTGGQSEPAKTIGAAVSAARPYQSPPRDRIGFGQGQ